MKSLLLAATAVLFAATVNLSAAAAAKLLAPTPGQLFPEIGDGEATGTAVATPHYEWQYRYVGRHARYEGHWVLVR
jgi:hypothetical protein